MKPFDIEAAKRGEPVCTVDGREVRLYAFDSKRMCCGRSTPIIGEWTERDGIACALGYWSLDGLFNPPHEDHYTDLRMASRKQMRYVVTFTDGAGDVAFWFRSAADRASYMLGNASERWENVATFDQEVEV